MGQSNPVLQPKTSYAESHALRMHACSKQASWHADPFNGTSEQSRHCSTKFSATFRRARSKLAGKSAHPLQSINSPVIAPSPSTNLLHLSPRYHHPAARPQGHIPRAQTQHPTSPQTNDPYPARNAPLDRLLKAANDPTPLRDSVREAHSFGTL